MNRLLFFLEEKKQKKIICRTGILCAFAAFANALHKTDGSYVNRLLFFLEEKKQKKINCGASFLRCCCCFHQRIAQNGRFVCEPSVFRFKQDERESCSSQTNDLPRNVFCFFSSRKEIVPLKKEKIVPPGLRRKAARASARKRPAWRRPPSRGHGASEYGSAQETQRPSAASRPHRRAAPPRRGIRAPPQAAGT